MIDIFEFISLEHNLNELIKKIYKIGQKQNLDMNFYILDTFTNTFEKFKLEGETLKKEPVNFEKDFINQIKKEKLLTKGKSKFFGIYLKGNLVAILEILGKDKNFPLEPLLKILKNSVEYHYLYVQFKKEKLTVENVSEAVVLIDKSYSIKEVNNSFLELLGYRYSVKELLGRNILEFLDYLSEELLVKLDKVKNQLLPEELVSDLIKLKIIPLVIKEKEEEKLLSIALIFKYPKG
jgi:PAS domain-containing protein